MAVYSADQKIKIEKLITDDIEEKSLVISKMVIGLAIKKIKFINHNKSRLKVFKDWKVKQYSNLNSNQSDNVKFVFVFVNGTVIFWNFTEQEEREILEYIFEKPKRKIEFIEERFNYLENIVYERDSSFFVRDSVKEDIIFLEVGL